MTWHTELESGDIQLIIDLAESFDDPGFRSEYMAQHLRAFLADQIRGLRGAESQAEFGVSIGKPQSVVSRLENEQYGRLSLQTLIDVAQRRDIGLVVRFVDYPTFLMETSDLSESALRPQSYDKPKMRELIQRLKAARHRTELSHEQSSVNTPSAVRMAAQGIVPSTPESAAVPFGDFASVQSTMTQKAPVADRISSLGEAAASAVANSNEPLGQRAFAMAESI